jgi:hypothetical protein
VFFNVYHHYYYRGHGFLLCGWRGLRDNSKPGVMPGLWSFVVVVVVVVFGYDVTGEQDHYAHLIS